jgi:hypothetical protein
MYLYLQSLAINTDAFYSVMGKIEHKFVTENAGQLDDWPHWVFLIVPEAEWGGGTGAIWICDVFLLL